MKKIQLNKNKSVDSVNIDNYVPLSFLGTNRLLPNTEISKIIDVSEVFIKENNESNIFRVTATVNPLFTNILTNVTGVDSLSSFNESRFRDKASPVNASLNLKENISFKTSIFNNKLLNNGWVGYYNPLLLSNDCKQIDLHPKRNEMNLLGDNGIKNWDVCISYPYQNDDHPLVSNGLPITDYEIVEYNGRDMVRFVSLFNHGLNVGDKVKLYGITPASVNDEYLVYKVGLSDGDLKENFFIVDINTSITLNNSSTFKRVYNGKESKYYFRIFRKVKMVSNLLMENDDYEIFQMGFANNVFGDNIIQINFNEDIDLTDLVDNLNRPICELYVSFFKKSDSMFSTVKSGFDLNYIDGVYSQIIPDIRRITNDTTSSFPFLESNLSINQDTFYGDLVEFNDFEVREKVLNDINHRFNTNNRDNGGFITSDGGTIDMGKRYEGYVYKPHHLIKIREISDYIEQGGINDEKPDYAIDLGDGRFLWRDVYDYGNSPNLDIPFLNGCHYINKLINLHLKRQDPFGYYGLFYNTFPRDYVGELLDTDEIKINDDEC